MACLSSRDRNRPKLVDRRPQAGGCSGNGLAGTGLVKCRMGPMIIAIEAGKYALPLLLAFGIASAFGVSVEDVFQYDGQADVPPAW